MTFSLFPSQGHSLQSRLVAYHYIQGVEKRPQAQMESVAMVSCYCLIATYLAFQDALNALFPGFREDVKDA